MAFGTLDEVVFGTLSGTEGGTERGFVDDHGATIDCPFLPRVGTFVPAEAENSHS